MKRYRVVLRYYGRAGLVEYDGEKWVPIRDIVVDNPELVRIVPFPAPDPEATDLIAIYEFVPEDVEVEDWYDHMRKRIEESEKGVESGG